MFVFYCLLFRSPITDLDWQGTGLQAGFHMIAMIAAIATIAEPFFLTIAAIIWKSALTQLGSLSIKGLHRTKRHGILLRVS